MEKFNIKIGKLTRDLTLYRVNDKLSIAGFILFGDTEITVESATELLKKCPEFDFIVTPECKSIPLAYEMSKQSGKKYFVIRKSKKVYLKNPISAEVNSITTQKTQNLYLGEEEILQIQGKRILFVDDVISTGNSLSACENLLKACGANLVAKAFVLAEGDAKLRKDIIFLSELPLFFD